MSSQNEYIQALSIHYIVSPVFPDTYRMMFRVIQRLGGSWAGGQGCEVNIVGETLRPTHSTALCVHYESSGTIESESSVKRSYI